jgi:hypothetical protein
MHGYALAVLGHYLSQEGNYGLTPGQCTNAGIEPH